MTKIPKRSSIPTRFNVEVTPADIERAQKNDSYKCVVAQAIARTVPDATQIDVDTQTIRMTRGDERWLYLTPYAVQGYVVAFDAGEAIESFSFQLRNPDRRPRRKSTAAGKEADRRRTQAKAAAKKSVSVKAHERAAPGEKRAPQAEASREEINAAARAAYAAARREQPDEPFSTGFTHRTPRVFKTKRRAYGNRLLRINRIEESEAS